MSSLLSTSEIIQAKRIGASQIAAVAGISPFDKRWDIWADIMGRVGAKEQTERMFWGIKLEPLIAEVFSARKGIPVEWWNRRIDSARYPWQAASPDAFLLSHRQNRPVREGILECKTAGLDQAGEWDRESDNEDGVPEHYVAQVQWQMTTCELYTAYIAVLIAGNDFRIYEIHHDPVLEEILLEEAEEFWRMYIMSNTEPPISGSDRAREYLRKKFPVHKKTLRPPNEAEIELLQQYAELRDLLDQATDHRKALENQITQSIGDAEGLDWEKGRFTWKRTKDRMLTDWKKLSQDHKELVQQYTRIEPGCRRIYFREKE